MNFDTCLVLSKDDFSLQGSPTSQDFSHDSVSWSPMSDRIGVDYLASYPAQGRLNVM
jgi:hypothetical protein